jgi:peptidoglycan hydrolase CwlO-like protein
MKYMEKMKKTVALIVVWALVLPAFVVSQISFWGLPTKAETTATTAIDQTAVEDTRDSISDLQKKLKREQEDYNKLNQNYLQIQQSVASAQKDISKTQSLIKQTANDIARKESDIEEMNAKLELQKETLKAVLQELYYVGSQPLASIVLSGQEFAYAFGISDQMIPLQDRINSITTEINNSKDKIQQDKEELAKAKEEHEQLLGDKLDQKDELVSDQLDVKADLADQQKVINRLQKELSELQGDLNKLLGKSYSAKDIKEAVEFASRATGVPKGFLVGVLKMETNLGANVGGCTYGEVEKGAEASYKAGKLSKRAWTTFQNRREVFKDITSELDLDYKSQKVSCNPRGYVGTGGAMGVAQFMPDTWVGYKSQVASITGNNPPSPWSLGDGVTAMALKLKKTPGVTDGKESAMKSAACSYLGTCYAPYINGILYWADNYKELLN